MQTSHDLSKAFASRVAERAAADEVVGALRLLRAAGLLAEHERDTASDRDPGRGGERSAVTRVGIWERAAGASHFARRMDRTDDWHWWANVGRIDPKRGRRVVFLGESAARGFGYDPQFTPAGALERLLVERLGPDRVDVVDLAKTNLNLPAFGSLAESALVLEPDVLVVFAGNNWGPSTLDAAMGATSSHGAAATALRGGGVAGFKACIEEAVEAAVRATVHHVATMYRERGIPVVWMVPEFCLADWRDPVTNAPVLGDACADWGAAWSAAREALAADDLERAARCAERMIACDGGTTTAGFYLLAQDAVRRGDTRAARRSLEAARDAQIWTAFPKAPRPYVFVQRVLREQAASARTAVVDLPALLDEHLGGALPDRRLFLDYCHLTASGIAIAMGAAASAVLPLLDGAHVPWRELAARCPQPEPRLQAAALLYAAIHCAHWGQSAELVRYYCDEAVQRSPHVAAAMTAFTDLQTRRAPMWMCRAAQDIAALPLPSLRSYLLRANTQQLDTVLLDAMVGSLSGHDRDARGRLDRLRRDERSVAHGAVDLLDPYYYASEPHEFAQLGSWESRSRDDDLPAQAFYTAYSPESRFPFIADAGCPVTFELTGRLATRHERTGTVTVVVNGSPRATVSMTSRWRCVRVAVEGDVVQDGINRVVVQWPPLDQSGGPTADELADRVLTGAVPELYPVFGEIHAFVASRTHHDPASRHERQRDVGAAQMTPVDA